MIEWMNYDVTSKPQQGREYLLFSSHGFELGFISTWGYWSNGNIDLSGVTHYAELTYPNAEIVKQEG